MDSVVHKNALCNIFQAKKSLITEKKLPLICEKYYKKGAGNLV